MDESRAPADPAAIRAAVRGRYRALAAGAADLFPYPTGRAGALALGYSPAWLEGVPGEVVERFVGVGCPFSIRAPARGERVLDVGCGSGLDARVAARMVGAGGRVVGLDFSPEMLRVARGAEAAPAGGNLEFREGDVERLPFEDGAFDVVLSNGVVNLVPDKGAAFREIRRVLRAGGLFAAADIVVLESVPAELLASMDAWST